MKVVLSGEEILDAIADYVAEKYGMRVLMNVNLMYNKGKFICEITEVDKPKRRKINV